MIPTAAALDSEMRRRLRLHAAALSLGVLIVIAMIAANIHRDWQEHVSRREEGALHLARALSRQSQRTLQSIDRVLVELVDRVARDPSLLDASDERATRLLGDLGRLSPAEIAFGLADATGAVVAASTAQGRRAPVSIAERPAFRRHREKYDPSFFISESYASKPSGLTIFTISRGIYDRDGGFLGMAAATILTTHLFELLREVRSSAEDRIVLVRQDGLLLACHDRCPLGADLSKGPVMRRVHAGMPSGVTRTNAPLDGKTMIAAFQAVDEFPLVAISAMPLAPMFRDWIGESSLHLAIPVATLFVVPIGALLFFRSVRRQMAIDRQRRESSDRRFVDGIESMVEGFVLWDAEDRLVTWNRRFIELFPMHDGAMVAGARFEQVLEAAAARGRPDRTPEQQAQWLARRVAQHREPLGRPFVLRPQGRVVEGVERPTSEGGIVTIYRDVTERVEREQELQRALLAEREGAAQQRRFVAVASHEFRTPLAVIDSAAQVIAAVRRGESNADIDTRLARIRNSVARMTDLIDRTLSSARLEEGAIKADPAPLDLHALIAGVCDRQRSISPKFRIDLISNEMPLAIEGDTRLLEQVFTNLVTNAVKYSGQSSEIRVAIDGDVDHVAVRVSDSGIGIPAAEVTKLFTRYFRASTASGISGTGIGLHLVRELVALHGGSVSVESEVGRGTTFTVRLPRRFAGACAVAPAAAA